MFIQKNIIFNLLRNEFIDINMILEYYFIHDILKFINLIKNTELQTKFYNLICDLNITKKSKLYSLCSNCKYLSNWSILSDLQTIINDKNLSKKAIFPLKTKLYQLINKNLPNNNTPKNASYLSDKKLEKAFWKNF